MKKEFLKSESGRSMVEMLGVLAVIGVLTVIGIAGFRYAMNKHYANQTVDRLMRRAVVVAAQANFGQNLSLHEFDENDGEYPITLLARTDNESFTMQADNVPNEVCQLIVGLDWQLAKIIPENCSDTSMKFKFLNDLGDCSTCVAESVDCPPDEELQCGSCSVVRGFIDNDADCEGNENGQYCVRGKCSTCEKGQFWGGYGGPRCLTCPETGYQCVSSDQADKCYGTSFYSGSYGQCKPSMVGCKATNEVINGADAEGCKQCPNRCYSAGTCNLFGPDKTNLSKNADGTCNCNTEIGAFEFKDRCCLCPENQFINTYTGKCAPCGEWHYAVDAEKHKCLGIAFYTAYKDGKHYGGDGFMASCSDAGTWSTKYEADELSCTRCSNRCYKASDQSCRLVDGSTYQRISAEDGRCQE